MRYGKKKSNFVGVDEIPNGAYVDHWINGQNYKTTIEVLYQAISDNLFPQMEGVKTVVSPYTLTADDSGQFLVFNTAGVADIVVPDNLDVGVMFSHTNVGAGTSRVVMTTESLRGLAEIGDADGYATVTKILLDTWQSSERPASGGGSGNVNFHGELTSAEILALVGMNEGDLAFSTTIGGLCFYNGTVWKNHAGGLIT